MKGWFEGARTLGLPNNRAPDKLTRLMLEDYQADFYILGLVIGV
jgi:hypothetical protein